MLKYVSWPNSLSSWRRMWQAVHHLLPLHLLFFYSSILPISPSNHLSLFFLFLWIPFLLFIVLSFVFTPDATKGKLDFSNVILRLTPVLNPKCALCVAMLKLKLPVCCTCGSLTSQAYCSNNTDQQIEKLYTHTHYFIHATLKPALHYQSTRGSVGY